MGSRPRFGFWVLNPGWHSWVLEPVLCSLLLTVILSNLLLLLVPGAGVEATCSQCDHQSPWHTELSQVGVG